jgi:hypothetical protein
MVTNYASPLGEQRYDVVGPMVDMPLVCAAAATDV